MKPNQQAREMTYRLAAKLARLLPFLAIAVLAFPVWGTQDPGSLPQRMRLPGGTQTFVGGGPAGGTGSITATCIDIYRREPRASDIMTPPAPSGGTVTRQPVSGGPVEGPISLNDATDPNGANWFEIRGSDATDRLSLRFTPSELEYRYTLHTPTDSVALIGPSVLETSAESPLSAAFAELQLRSSPEGKALCAIDALLRSIELRLKLAPNEAYSLHPGLQDLQWVLAFKSSSDEHLAWKQESSSQRKQILLEGAQAAIAQWKITTLEFVERRESIQRLHNVEAQLVRHNVAKRRDQLARKASDYLRFLHTLARLLLPSDPEAGSALALASQSLGQQESLRWRRSSEDDIRVLKPYEALVTELLEESPSAHRFRETKDFCTFIAKSIETNGRVESAENKKRLRRTLRMAAYEEPMRVPKLQEALHALFPNEAHPLEAVTGWDGGKDGSKQLGDHLAAVNQRWSAFLRAASDKDAATKLHDNFRNHLLSAQGDPRRLIESFEQKVLPTWALSFPHPIKATWYFDGVSSISGDSSSSPFALMTKPPDAADAIALAKLCSRGSASVEADPYSGHAMLGKTPEGSYRLRTPDGELRWTPTVAMPLRQIKEALGDRGRLVADDALWKEVLEASPEAGELNPIRTPTQTVAHTLKQQAFVRVSSKSIEGVGLVNEMIRVNRREEGSMTMWVIQLPNFGDAILLRSPDGRILLVDTGHSAEACRRIMAALKHLTGGESTIDILITHPHTDHVGGFSAILAGHCDPPDGVVIGQVMVGLAPISNEPQRKLLTKLADRNSGFTERENIGGPGLKVFERTADFPRRLLKIERLSADADPVQRYQISGFEGVQVQVFQVADGREVNDSSLLVRVEYEGTRWLLTGDISYPAMRTLAAWGGDLSADIMKNPHHASSAANAPGADQRAARDFQNKVSAHYVFFSNYGPGQTPLTEARARQSYLKTAAENGRGPIRFGGTNPRPVEVTDLDIRDVDALIRGLRGRGANAVRQAVFDRLEPKAQELLAQPNPTKDALIPPVVAVVNSLISGPSLASLERDLDLLRADPVCAFLRTLEAKGDPKPLNRWIIERAFGGAFLEYEPGGTLGMIAMLRVDVMTLAWVTRASVELPGRGAL